MRLIDADALNTVLDFYIAGCNLETAQDKTTLTVALGTKKLVAKMPTISPAAWVPCAERLPKEHKRGTIMCSDLVAVTVKNSTRGTVYTAVDYTVNGKWETYEVMETGCTVLAWQPLPEPYRGGE